MNEYDEKKNVDITNEDQLVAAEQSTSILPSQAKEQQMPSFFYAGFWMRFWAYLLDLIIIMGLNNMMIKPIFRATGLPLSESGVFTAYGIATGVIFYLYFILMTKYFQQTLGKMVFGLKVVGLKGEKLSWGTVIFREGVGRYISATFSILYSVIAFTPKKQGIHDLFADTTVIHEPRSAVKPAYS